MDQIALLSLLKPRNSFYRQFRRPWIWTFSVIQKEGVLLN